MKRAYLFALLLLASCGHPSEPDAGPGADRGLPIVDGGADAGRCLPGYRRDDQGGCVAETSLGPTPRVLFVGPSELAAAASELDRILDLDPEVDDATVGFVPLPAPADPSFPRPGLAAFAYLQALAAAPTEPLLDESWDVVILIEDPVVQADYPELHFEGLRLLASRFGEARVVSAPLDGRELAVAQAYRAGNGTGVAVLPVVSSIVPAASVVAARAYVGLLGRSVVGLAPPPDGVDGSSWFAFNDGLLDLFAREAERVHYTGGFDGVVRISTDAPPTGFFRYARAGTSSETLWSRQLDRLVSAQGLTPRAHLIGNCDTGDEPRMVDRVCVDAVVGEAFLSNPIALLYSRGYEVGANAIDEAQIRAAWGQPALQSQVYDRHFDAVSQRGMEAANTQAIVWLDGASRFFYDRARAAGAAWIPMHIAFARLRLEDDTVPLLADPVHASEPVLFGLAAESYVARTGQSPNLDAVAELAPQSRRAAEIGEQVIRQLSTLSVSGEAVPDDPGTRPTLRSSPLRP